MRVTSLPSKMIETFTGHITQALLLLELVVLRAHDIAGNEITHTPCPHTREARLSDRSCILLSIHTCVQSSTICVGPTAYWIIWIRAHTHVYAYIIRVVYATLGARNVCCDNKERERGTTILFIRRRCLSFMRNTPAIKAAAGRWLI
jgi:hypothetical protein